MPDEGLPTETETKLVIVADDSARVADEIAALTRLGRYLLIPRADERLRDTYWDGPDGRLGAERVALRLRLIGSATMITLKGPTKIVPDGAAVRMEIEEPWSAAALARVRKLLSGAGLWPTKAPDPVGFHGDAVASLRQAGFIVVQDRETERRPRDVVTERDPQQAPAAELVIDVTTFHLGTRSVLNREIEVETKGPGGRETVGEVTGGLLELYPSLLRLSDGSKLAMGKAIAASIEALVAGNGLAPDGSLTLAGYALLNKCLREARG